MSYTVQEVARLSCVTIKVLYHYHKIGLLIPESVAENGYRFYGEKELERLQQILFFRELDFPLEKIRTALDHEPDRLRCLWEQYSMLKEKEKKLADILHTLDEAIKHEQKGVPMNKDKMFYGLNKKEWENVMEVQNEHLQKEYGYEIVTSNLKVEDMNDRANEALWFMSFMTDSLKRGIGVDDHSVTEAIEKHIKFMQQDMDIDANGYAAQTRFLMNDDFHRQMMEGQQIGLSYYICYAAENYAKR